MLGWKYANLCGCKAVEDLSANHGLSVSKKKLQSVNEALGSVLADKERKWAYAGPVLEEEVYSVGISRDGTTTPIKGERHKETMAGTISLYNESGARLHTIYTGCAPEQGKETFDYVFSQEIERVKVKYQNATYVAVADGAKDNWSFLQDYASIQTIDYWHVCEYLSEYGKVAYSSQQERDKWQEDSYYKLKYQSGAAGQLLEEMKEYAAAHFLADNENPVSKAITYFENNKSKMDYAKNLEMNLPIGSGVVEAACKTLVKQRFSKSGCRWTRNTVEDILMSRSLIMTGDRWEQFWKKVDRYGY
jgi:hypothetical protein